MNVFKKNTPKWNNKEIKRELKNFIELYKTRPIRKNIHGMRFNHMFATYFLLKKIKPKLIVENGVFKGQSTWLIEKTLPKSKIISIDIKLNQREYISKKVKYSNLDFKFHDFSKIPRNSLVFFDDHQNHLQRLQQAKFFNFKHVILEDNYPPNHGDFYTIKHAYHNSGFYHPLTFLSLCKTLFLLIKLFLKKIIKNKYYISLNEINSRIRDWKPNKIDFKVIEKNIDIYYEFPPLMKSNKYNLCNLIDNHDFNDELKFYNYITYIKFK